MEEREGGKEGGGVSPPQSKSRQERRPNPPSLPPSLSPLFLLPVLLRGVNALLALLPDILEGEFLPGVLKTTQELREGRREGGKEGERVSPDVV